MNNELEAQQWEMLMNAVKRGDRSAIMPAYNAVCNSIDWKIAEEGAFTHDLQRVFEQQNINKTQFELFLKAFTIYAATLHTVQLKTSQSMHEITRQMVEYPQSRNGWIGIVHYRAHINIGTRVVYPYRGNGPILGYIDCPQMVSDAFRNIDYIPAAGIDIVLTNPQLWTTSNGEQYETEDQIIIVPYGFHYTR